MPGDDPFAFLATSEHKPPVKKTSLWKEKLFSRDKHNRSSTDQQVEAFLGPSRSKSLSHGPATPRGLSAAASKWPSPHDVVNASSSGITDNYKLPRRKNPARRGLKVTFAQQMPELIGEGGDESEVPTIEVSIRRNRVRSQSMPQPKNAPALPEKAPPSSGAPQLRLDTSPSPRKKPDDGPEAARPLLLQNPQDSDFLMTLNLGERGSRLSFRASPESNSFAQRVRQKMQLEEGRALQKRASDADPPSPTDHAPEVEEPPKSPDSSGSMYETPPFSVTEPTPPANALHNPPSPPSRGSDIAAPEPRRPEPPLAAPTLPEPTLPFGIKPGNQPLHRTPTKAIKPTNPEVVSALKESSRPSSRDIQESAYQPQPPRVSLRAVTNQLSDNAFIEFQDYVANFNRLFRMTAESVKPLMETSLAEWMRAAVWWFLRGRKALEAYARSRPSSTGPGMYPRSPLLEAKQAVLDLGKALWINETIFTQHEELTRYGATSVEALQSVVNTTGDKQLGDVLDLHQGILNHLRSLAMSIKRNNILANIAASQGSADQFESNLWVRYPFFAPDVSAVLSGAATRSMLVDRSGSSPSMTTMMPLSDTPRHFSYGTMFVDVYVSSSEDDNQQFAIPCALSILRDRTDWYVFAAINSQSELVNVMIQSDRKKGPTWKDVEWQVRTNSMRVRLPRSFELDVMFQEDDFKMIWNIVKYTLKTEDSLQPESGESVIFENTLKVFQYMDPAPVKAFPAEPIERCRFRLFERSVNVTEGTGTRSVHQGFRITVLTSPKVKTLSSVRHVLGYGAPIVFGLLRGKDGAPAVVIKATEEERTRSMLMTFHEEQERSIMHSMLLGMLVRPNEMKVSDVPFRAYSIVQPADRVTGGAPVVHLQFPTGNVHVLDRHPGPVEHQYGPTILSENLRACVVGDWGFVTDRINLGMFIYLVARMMMLTVAGPGELKLGLDVTNRTGLSLYRPGQTDMTLSVAENLAPAEATDSLSELLPTTMVKPMIRRFNFATLEGMYFPSPSCGILTL